MFTDQQTRRVNAWHFVTLLLLLVSFPALESDAAPPQVENLSGLVLDVGKARIPDTLILVEGTNLRRAIKSAEDGSYAIQLPYGKYRVTVTCDGFYPSPKKTVKIRPNASVTLDVTLKGIRNDASHP